MAIVADNTANGTGSNSSQTYNHVLGVASGNSRIVIVSVGTYGNTQSVTGCTYNGVAMTAGPSLYLNQFGNIIGVAMFYILDSSLPASTGTYAVAFTYSGIIYNWASGTQSASGVGQSAPQATTSGSQNSGASRSTTLTGISANSWVVDGLCVNLSSGSGTPGASQVQIWDNNISGCTAMGSYYSSAAGGSQAMSWTFSGTGSTCCQVVASWQQAGAAASNDNALLLGCNM